MSFRCFHSNCNKLNQDVQLYEAEACNAKFWEYHKMEQDSSGCDLQAGDFGEHCSGYHAGAINTPYLVLPIVEANSVEEVVTNSGESESSATNTGLIVGIVIVTLIAFAGVGTAYYIQFVNKKDSKEVVKKQSSATRRSKQKLVSSSRPKVCPCKSSTRQLSNTSQNTFSKNQLDDSNNKVVSMAVDTQDSFNSRAEPSAGVVLPTEGYGLARGANVNPEMLRNVVK